MSKKHQFKLVGTCADYETEEFLDMIAKARPVSRRTFVERTNREDLAILEFKLGYGSTGDTMAKDPLVGYYKSKLKGEPVYFFRHLATEYIFGKEPDQ